MAMAAVLALATAACADEPRTDLAPAIDECAMLTPSPDSATIARLAIGAVAAANPHRWFVVTGYRLQGDDARYHVELSAVESGGARHPAYRVILRNDGCVQSAEPVHTGG